MFFYRYADGHDVVHDVAEDGHQDQADEHLRDSRGLYDRKDILHQVLGDQDDASRGACQHEQADGNRPAGTLCTVLLMGLPSKGEEHGKDVDNDQQAGQRRGEQARTEMGVFQLHGQEHAGQPDGYQREGHEGEVYLDEGAAKSQVPVPETRKKEARAQHEEELPQDRAYEAGSHDDEQSLLERHDRNDHLGGVAEGGVEQPPPEMGPSREPRGSVAWPSR